MLERKIKSKESPSLRAPSVSLIATTLERDKPTIDTMTEMMKPTIGPDAPISISAFLVTIGDFIFIKAPNVPIIEISGGAGIKYGSVAFVLCFLDAK